MDPEFQIAVDVNCEIGEGPLWHPEEEALYWIDIPNGRLFKYKPSDKRYQVVTNNNNQIGGFTFQTDGSILLFMGNRSVKSLRNRKIHTVIKEKENTPRFNDVIADPAGRVFCGLFPTPDQSGSLLCLDLEGILHEVLSDVGAPNGMGFSPNNDKFYFTDSIAKTIYKFDYNIENGKISNCETLASFHDERIYSNLSSEHYPVPDGMAVDNDGNIWTCLFGGEGIIQLDSTGKEIIRLETPVSTSTSLTFGGTEYQDMFITSLRPSENDSKDTNKGALFQTRLNNVRGRKENLSKVRI